MSVATLCICVLLVFSCSLKLKVGVINNTEEIITIVSGEETMMTYPGQMSVVTYPTVAQLRTVRVFAGKCSYSYIFPDSIGDYAKIVGFDGVVMVQLERNYQLYLVSPRAIGVVVITNEKSINIDGFPLNYTKRECAGNKGAENRGQSTIFANKTEYMK